MLCLLYRPLCVFFAVYLFLTSLSVLHLYLFCCWQHWDLFQNIMVELSWEVWWKGFLNDGGKGLWCCGISEKGALKGTGELSWISEGDRRKKEREQGMMQEVNLGRKSLLVLRKPLLCHHMLDLRISIGEENQYVACRLYRTVLLIHASGLSLYIITSFAALTAYKSQKNSYRFLCL